MFTKLLKNYCRVTGDLAVYKVLKEYKSGDHELAWLAIIRPGATEPSHELHCECRFTAEVGWTWEEGRLVLRDRANRCDYRQTQLRLRHHQLWCYFSAKYQDRIVKQGPHGPYDSEKYDYYRDIILDLIAKSSYGEFIGEYGTDQRSGHGYFYFTTLKGIMRYAFPVRLWEFLDEMAGNNEISLSGGLIGPPKGPKQASAVA